MTESGPDYRNLQRDYVADALFLARDSPDRRDRIVDHMGTTPQHVMVAAMDGLQAYDPAEVAAGSTAPPSISPPTSPSRSRT
jgi:hypothetical protein